MDVVAYLPADAQPTEPVQQRDGLLHDPPVDAIARRLRYGGSASTWGFAIYRASHDDYENSVLPTGYPAGTPQEALDGACGLYLGDHTSWLNQLGAPTSLVRRPVIS